MDVDLEELGISIIPIYGIHFEAYTVNGRVKTSQ
jgi:hypothetical protein